MKKFTLIIFLLIIPTVQSFSQAPISSEDFKTLPSTQWKFKANKPFVSSPVVDGTTVYAGNLDSNLYAVNLSDGKLKWKFKTRGIIRSTVCISGNQLFLLSGDGNLYSLDKGSGKIVWTFKTGGDKPYDIFDYFQSSPVISDRTIYFGCGDANVYAVNMSDGTLLWKYQTGDVVHSVPAISNGKLYIGSFDGYVYALDATNGSLIWKFKSVGQYYFPKGEMQFSPVVANGLVFIGGRDFNLYAIDMNKGYCHWNKYYPRGWAPVITPSPKNDSIIYVGTSDPRILEAINGVTGESIWTAKINSNIFGACAFTQSMCYVTSLAGKVYGVDLKTGIIEWTFASDGSKRNHDLYFTPDDDWNDSVLKTFKRNEDFLTALDKMGAIYSAPTIVKDLMLVNSSDGTIYCLKKE